MATSRFVWSSNYGILLHIFELDWSSFIKVWWLLRAWQTLWILIFRFLNQTQRIVNPLLFNITPPYFRRDRRTIVSRILIGARFYDLDLLEWVLCPFVFCLKWLHFNIVFISCCKVLFLLGHWNILVIIIFLNLYLIGTEWFRRFVLIHGKFSERNLMINVSIDFHVNLS